MPTGAAHVKRHTKGTSNEISLSVLDAAKNAVRPGRHKDDPKVGTVSLFTVPGFRKKPKGAPKKDESLLYDTGIGRRKRARGTWKSRPAHASDAAAPTERGGALRWLASFGAVAFVVAASIGLVALGASFVSKDVSHQSYQSDRLDTAIAGLQETDEVFESLDVLVNDPFGSHPEEEELVYARRSAVGDSLAEADAAAREASENLRDNREKEVAANAVATAASRTNLWNVGLSVVDEARAARAARECVEEGWQAVLDADIHLKKAASLVSDTTDENIRRANEETNAASASLQQAVSLFMEAQNAYPSYDVALFLDYLQKRIESCGYALASNQALLDRDKETAQAQNDAYNQADQEAVELAEGLPNNPVASVKDVFEASVADKMKDYETARSQTGNADAFIRDYLGEQGK
ncbi:hypothetical protein [Xiamenia xianingshaonis]|uniref:Uncharacterized protein n=1 Tax=Xiamenia xianingshaonis TaxID=2682776 RepID=A0A9E6SUM0_9ACTN|nr:hypothetical protein [Xiamenia xianingshaonis]NHM13930.1 hypothetical protein [Xiamenia xianingshaonis]QTU84382.1 hypothetical protein J7S26_00075 [Xiamenia xianingshaonis]